MNLTDLKADLELLVENYIVTERTQDHSEDPYYPCCIRTPWGTITLTYLDHRDSVKVTSELNGEQWKALSLGGDSILFNDLTFLREEVVKVVEENLNVGRNSEINTISDAVMAVITLNEETS